MTRYRRPANRSSSGTGAPVGSIDWDELEGPSRTVLDLDQDLPPIS